MVYICEVAIIYFADSGFTKTQFGEGQRYSRDKIKIRCKLYLHNKYQSYYFNGTIE